MPATGLSLPSLGHACFADDLAFMSHTKHQMQSKTDTLDEISRSIGLIQAGKSKILTSERHTIERVTLRNTLLEIVESFTYLGSIIDGKGGTEADVRTRIGKARTAFANLSNTWKASKISISTKNKTFQLKCYISTAIRLRDLENNIRGHKQTPGVCQ